MTRVCTTVAVGLALTLAAAVALAQRTRLDDSLSPVQTHSVMLAWSPIEMTRALNALAAGALDSMPAVTGRVPNAEIRLDTRDFVGRAARIYLTLPIAASGAGGTLDLELRWEASGPFLAGAVRPGQSTLVFEGVIEELVTSASFDFVFALGSGAAADPFVLEPIYEIEPLR
jgi:hypothetical protein